MRSALRSALVALGIGAAATLVLFGLGWAAAAKGYVTLSYALYWQGWVLGVLVACPEIYCDVRPIHVIAFYAGLPLGVIIYAGLFHLARQFVRSRKDGQGVAA